jgi:DNA-binding NarL/FixJ family response regulator
VPFLWIPLNSVVAGDETGMNEMLSEREVSVVRLVAEGKTNQEIGTELGISPSTVKSHLTRIGFKLHARNRAEIVYRAAKKRVLTMSTNMR